MAFLNKKIEILDCTIRDGSYVVDFDWPLEKVVGIVSDLAANRCGFIEIGHGLGLGAERNHPHGAVSDEQYLREAAKVTTPRYSSSITTAMKTSCLAYLNMR